MLGRHRLLGSLVVCAAACLPASATAQHTSRTGELRVIVKDPSGAVIPGATVQVSGVEPATMHVSFGELLSDAQGIARVADLPPGRYGVTVSFPGFESQTLTDVRVRPGTTRREVVLPIQKIDESVSVGRDPATAASDPKGDRFDTVLSRDQIEALPDDPDEMERVLKEMAGPGATLRVDGFRGGRLPPKSQIRSIRFGRDMFAAENHAGGMVMIDITTQPGLGPLRGGIDINFRDDALNARNAFQPEKGPEQTQQYTLNLSGTLVKERTSFSLSATGASLYDSANVFAALPDGSRATPVRRPEDRVNVMARLDHALTKSHTLRGSFQSADADRRNLGVGSFDLAERAYSRRTTDRILRLSESGPWRRSLFAESRFQLRWQSMESASALEAPTIQVLDAFTSGGAQQAGGRHSTEIEWATNVDWARGKHAVRAGVLLEGGWYRSDARTNYLGTYTFTSLADFAAGRPATWSRRIGDPLVSYDQWQAGVFVQDDWRVRSNLTLSAGVRQEWQTNLDDGWNLAPRAGFTWSPFRNGRTTVRGGAGVFYDWLDAEVYEQTLRVDGVRQQELVITSPGYPDPFAGGLAQQILPVSKYVLSPDLVMPMRVMGNIGVSHQFAPIFGVNASYTRSRGYHRFRGRNVNAPDATGLRPDPTVGNVTQVESTAGLRGQMFGAGFNLNMPARRLFMFGHYMYARQENDADGPFSLPADSYDLSDEWGPAGVARHTVSAMLSAPVWRDLRIGLNGTARSGSPYNITTGRDDNGDAVFNDRPAAVGRNSGRSRGMWDLSARVSYAFGFGTRSGGAVMPGGPTVIAIRPGGGGGDLLGAIGGGGAEDKRVRFEIFAAASNLFNTVNPIGYSGVLTSPFYGRPTAALPGRRIDLGVRVGF